MRSAAAALLVAASLISSASAQIGANWTQLAANDCGPDLLIDDFSVVRQGKLPFPPQVDNTTRFLNALGADYGDDGQNLTFATVPADKVMRINVITTQNFWFSKFDASACFDTTNFHGIAFDMLAPVGGNMKMTLTQKNPDCILRTDYGPSDATYIPITNYMNPNGTKQSVIIPFADFKMNSGGKLYDFLHLKDWTLNQFSPAGSTWEISNLRLMYACKGNGPLGTNSTGGPTTSTVNPATTNPAGGAPAAGTTPAAGGAAGGAAAPSSTGAAGSAQSAVPAKSSAGQTLYAFASTVFGASVAFLGGAL
ncbi:hypothetical protein HDU87_003447 [Geranomyces variabilis]|uniref:Uncharacterized protein n=1 Tax=Geranomyces variabilis TaxID=109894 RepID=A0AAD5TJQ0_9FUNG|nr:hypothetical protein HDU87_003447 [Geranomyces variabilis]